MKCKHYFITHDSRTPRGCKVYQIKAAQLPSQIVKQANNGSECMGFEEKRPNKPTQKNLNDSRYW
jgi:hypothetical protein